MSKPIYQTEGFDRLHLWWELSYAQYLTIPRSVMQSMPDDWQKKMADLLNELDDTIDWRPKNDLCYKVELREMEYGDGLENEAVWAWGKEHDDPLADYRRGNRRIEHKQKV